MRDAPTYQEAWVWRRKHRISTEAHRRRVAARMYREVALSAFGRWLLRWMP